MGEKESCAACGKIHDPFISLSKKCLATVKVPSRAEILRALEAGRVIRDTAEQSRPSFVNNGRYYR